MSDDKVVEVMRLLDERDELIVQQLRTDDDVLRWQLDKDLREKRAAIEAALHSLAERQ